MPTDGISGDPDGWNSVSTLEGEPNWKAENKLFSDPSVNGMDEGIIAISGVDPNCSVEEIEEYKKDKTGNEEGIASTERVPLRRMLVTRITRNKGGVGMGRYCKNVRCTTVSSCSDYKDEVKKIYLS